MTRSIQAFLSCIILITVCVPADAREPHTAEDIFTSAHRNLLVMNVEAAIAEAQADYGVIPQSAADEIREKADTNYAPLSEIEEEYSRVRHRMVALLNVWRRSLSDEADEALHKGVTTVDIYDTVLALQLLQASDLMLEEMLVLEGELVCLADRHKDTPMMGRTLGQHALPITFGKKVAGWAALTRRNIDRVQNIQDRLRRVSVLKGAVGTHVGLGPDGYEIEKRTAEILGLGVPAPADSRATRDEFAEYATTMALIARTHAAIGNEIFHLQMTDLGELYERRISTAVGSSTMPHKRNPSLSESLIHNGRLISALSDVILEDVINSFERDNTSRPNEILRDIALASADMASDTLELIERLQIDPDRMRANMGETDGMIMSQRIVLYLAAHVSREEAEMRLRKAADQSLETGRPFREALLADPVLRRYLEGELDRLLNPTGYVGLASEQVSRTRAWIAEERASIGQPALKACAN